MKYQLCPQFPLGVKKIKNKNNQPWLVVRLNALSASPRTKSPHSVRTHAWVARQVPAEGMQEETS